MAPSSLKGKTTRRLGLQVHLGILVAIFMFLAGLTISVIGYREVVSNAEASIHREADDLATIVRSEIVQAVRQPVQPTLSTLAQGPLAGYVTLEERLSHVPVLASLLNSYPALNAFWVGYADGDFFLLAHLVVESERRKYEAPDDAEFLVFSVTRNGKDIRYKYFFYNRELRLISRIPAHVLHGYDPRSRLWYQEAMRMAGQVEISPFITASQLPVMLFAEKSRNDRAVIGASVSLYQLGAILKNELPTPNSCLAVFRPDGTFVAGAGGVLTGSNTPRMRVVDDLAPILRQAVGAYMHGQRGRDIVLNEGGQDWRVALEEFRFNGGTRDLMILAIPENDLLSGGMTFLRYAMLGIGVIFILSLPLVWFILRRISHPLRALAVRAGAMHEFMHEGHAVQSEVSEIQDLVGGMHALQGNIRKMLTITQAISSERDFDALLQRVLEETLSVVKADGGLVALLDEEKRTVLDYGAVCWAVQGKKVTQPFNSEIKTPDMTLTSYQALAQNTLLQTSISRDDRRSRLASVAPGFVDPEVDRLDLLCVPLHDRMGEHIGMLHLFKALKDGDKGFQADEISFIESFAPTVAIALENQRLLKGQTELRDALILILAGAIDAKSPYTGGHCQRVPVIFQMLLEAACQEKEGPFRDFTLDEDGWEAARLAAWLHDCGKVTTPEYVVDKATKLETLHNRIHEIRTRFEVLKRDAEIASLRAVLAGDDPQAAQKALEDEQRALDEDFTFVATCNIGTEYMDDEAIRRLTAISGRTWLRTLDKRLGVSRDERARMGRAGEAEFPVREKLLIDSPEHILERGESDKLSPQNPWGFKVTPPEALYNRGELYNLSIRRGTLTAEERYKVNDHISRTIIMLEGMPLPKHLRSVPEIAGAHHETMDGRGYPRGLKRENMSPEARMMAVADIFEALTAGDRPYKPGKTLREALEIMVNFRDENHIDPEVYELFLKAEIPQKYAAKYLKPDQNDLRPAGAA